MSIEDNILNTLSLLGEDTARPGLRDTPRRVAKSLAELTSGYGKTLGDVVGNGVFPSNSMGMVLQKDIEFQSLCEHHMLPFYGTVSIAYTPKDKIIGLSKLGRIVDLYAKRLQVQEHLTEEVAKAIVTILDPEFVAVQIRANHMCMVMRGIKKQGGETITQSWKGVKSQDPLLREQVLRIF